MTLSEQQKKIIADYPLGGTLDNIRNKLRDSNEADEMYQTYISGLLALLTSLTAVIEFPLNVAGRLVALRLDLRNGKIANLDPFRPLVRAVVNDNANDNSNDNANDNSNDNAIWAAVFSLLDTLAPGTPPLRLTALPTFKGTPIKFSSNRLADSAGVDPVAKELFSEMRYCTFRDVGGFWDKFFNPESWPNKYKEMLAEMKTKHDGKTWTDFPRGTPTEALVSAWFRSLEKPFLADAPNKLHTTTSAHQFEEGKGQLDLFLQRSTTEASTIYSYKNVLVVGELQQSYNPGRFKADFLQLTRYVRSVFNDQPTRRFVHAFLLCGSMMELWIFDRAGAYSSGPFDIQEEPDRFARALVGYLTMDSEAMGLDTFIERVVEGEEQQRYVTLEDKRARLHTAMCKQNAIVCRGTTCFTTYDNEVVKFAWASGKRTSEVEHLTQAKKNGVKGVAEIVAHRRITSIAEMRKGLKFPAAHPFRDANSDFDDLPSATSTNTSGSKRKSPSDATINTASGSNKKQRPSIPRKGSMQPPSSTSKTKPSMQPSSSTSKALTKPTPPTPSEDLWEDRIYSCLVISPAGRVISEFSAIKQLLESMRDAIKAHQSLYVTGNILHRDISPNNIIITDPETPHDFKGMLIDLDMAKVRDSDPSGARQITGTIQFMAIEVMENVGHTYRHDLESFFYVLLWMCARQSWSNGLAGGDEQAPNKNLLDRWEKGNDFSEIARNKKGDILLRVMFEDILSQFPESFKVLKPLCHRIRKILFGLEGGMFLGTPEGDLDQFYRPIIEAYNEAIDKL